MELWVVVGAYLLGLLALGEVAARFRVGGLDDYLLSGRRQGTRATAATLAATVVGAGSTLGAAGVAYYVGVSAAWYLLSAAPALLLLGFTLAPALRRLSVYTVPEYLGIRYGRSAALSAAVLGLAALVLFLAAQFYAMGALLARVAGLSSGSALLVSAAAVVFYTWRGGNWAVHWSDRLQLVWIYAGLLVAGGFALRLAGGLDVLAEPPPARGYEALGAAWFHPVRRVPVAGHDPFALGNTVVAWVVMSATWHLAMQSTAQRVLAARDPGVARRACLWAAAALVPLAGLVALVGMAARVLLPDLEPAAGVEQVHALPALVGGVLPAWAAGLVLAALVAVLMSTCDSALLGAATIWVCDLRPARKAAAGAAAPGVAAAGTAGEGGSAGALRATRRALVAWGALALAVAWVAPGIVATLELVAAVYCVALAGPLLLGLSWSGATGRAAVAAIWMAALAGAGWRALGFEAATGLHMLNVGLPVSAGALLLVSLWERGRDGRRGAGGGGGRGRRGGRGLRAGSALLAGALAAGCDLTEPVPLPDLPTPIAFDSDRSGNRDVFVFHPGGRVVQLTDHPEFDGSPDWSPDGTRIAFYSLRDGNPEIYVMDADGSNVRRLTDDPAADGHPDWSPDGARIAFHSDRAGRFDVWVVNADGTDPVNLTPALDADAGFPAWSPDGTKIAFHAGVERETDLYLVNADGTGLVRLTRTGTFNARPAWSPDGRRLVFQSDRTGISEIYVMDADGSNLRRLTFDAYPDGAAAWSPDGQWIAYSSQRGGNAEIFLVPAEGGTPANLTRHPAFDAWPDWRPLP